MKYIGPVACMILGAGGYYLGAPLEAVLVLCLVGTLIEFLFIRRD
ncbi:MAG: hypothetical protein AB8B57_02460 [Congregibacter sp.]